LTPTPAPIVIRLDANTWQWNWSGPPSVTISETPGFPGMNTITLKKGQAYEIHIFSDAPDLGLAPHSFSGISFLGLNGIAAIPYENGHEFIQGFTPATLGSFFFNCTVTDCSDPGNIANEHDLMHGWINVTN